MQSTPRFTVGFSYVFLAEANGGLIKK